MQVPCLTRRLNIMILVTILLWFVTLMFIALILFDLGSVSLDTAIISSAVPGEHELVMETSATATPTATDALVTPSTSSSTSDRAPGQENGSPNHSPSTKPSRLSSPSLQDALLRSRKRPQVPKELSDGQKQPRQEDEPRVANEDLPQSGVIDNEEVLNESVAQEYMLRDQSNDPQQRVRILSWSPRAFVYENFLSQDECDYIINMSQPLMQPSQVVDSKTGTRKM